MRKCLVYCLAVILSYQMLPAREATNVEPLVRKMTSAKWNQNVPVEWSENGEILSLVYEPGTSNLFALIVSDTGGSDTLEKVDVETDGDIYYPIEDYFYMVPQTRWGGNRYVKFWRTIDGGDTWDPVSIIDSGDIKGVRIAFDNVSEYLFIAYIKGDSIFLVTSSDYGDSWDSPRKLSLLIQWETLCFPQIHQVVTELMRLPLQWKRICHLPGHLSLLLHFPGERQP